MKLLALECAGSDCSVALYIDGEIHQRHEQANAQQHSQLLLPMQQALMDEAGIGLADLDLLTCGHGPGSFTGVRVAVAVSQGLAFAADLPTLGVSSLAAMAWGAMHEHGRDRVLVAIDARMHELYWGCYARTERGLEAVSVDTLSRPEVLADFEVGQCLAVGNAWSAYADVLDQRAQQCLQIDTQYPQLAADVAALAANQLLSGVVTPISADSLQPLYLRNQVTHQQKAQRPSGR